MLTSPDSFFAPPRALDDAFFPRFAASALARVAAVRNVSNARATRSQKSPARCRRKHTVSHRTVRATEAWRARARQRIE